MKCLGVEASQWVPLACKDLVDPSEERSLSRRLALLHHPFQYCGKASKFVSSSESCQIDIEEIFSHDEPD